MRTWRVGTFSMGASLIFLGIFLFLSRFFGMNLLNVMTAWWPILLIVLGVEILLYLLFARQETPLLKFDFLSIFFVGLIGTAGISFAFLSSTGLLGRVDEVIARENRTFDLPNFSYKMDESVRRVVVNSAGYDLAMEAAKENEVAIFGTYQMETAKKSKLIKTAEDYVAANQKGDTLYITVKSLPNEAGPFYTRANATATLLIPSNVKLDVIGSGNSFSLKPRELTNDWNIERATSIVVSVPENSNLKVEAAGINDIYGNWKSSEKPGAGEEGLKNAVYQAGEGKYHINISNVDSVSLNTY